MMLLITGASGQLGGYLLRECRSRQLSVAAWSGSRTGELFGFPLQNVDLAQPEQIALAFAQASPTAIIHTAAQASVAECHRSPDRARAVNTHGTRVVAELARKANARLIHISTDLVFDGEKGPYREEDPTRPLSIYGQTKADAENEVLAVAGNLVARVSLLFGPTVIGRPTFFDHQVDSLQARRPMNLFEDEWRTPLSLATAARALMAMVDTDITGILHLGGPERLSRLEMGQRLAKSMGLDGSIFKACKRDQMPAAEPRPRDTSLDSSRWRAHFPEIAWTTWDDAIRELNQITFSHGLNTD